jgi:multiple sugar transport system substrate-binding protein
MKSLKNKSLLITGIILFCAGSLSAGGVQQQRGRDGVPIEIIYWDQNAGPERTPYVQQIINWYEESQNNIRVRYVGVPQAQFMEKMNVAVAGNAVPDVSGMQGQWISGFIARNALFQLDDLFRNWEDAGNFDQGILGIVRKMDVNGNLYMIPTRITYQCIWYRIDRFREAGLNPPQTWDDFFDSIARLTDVSKRQYGFTIRGGSGSAGQLQTIMFAYSGNKEYFDSNGVSALRDPAMLDFLTKFAGIYNRYTATGDINFDYQNMVAAFDSGVANMMHHNIASLGEHQKNLPSGSFGTIFFPKSVKGYYCSVVPNTNGYVVLKATKHPNESTNFLKFLGSKKSMSYWSQNVGDFPPRIDVLEEEWFRNADHMKNISAVSQSPDTVYVEVPQYLPEYNRIQAEIVEPGFQSVLMGKLMPVQFIDEWATAMEQAYKRYQENMIK